MSMLKLLIEALQKGRGMPAKAATKLGPEDAVALRAAAREAVPPEFTPVFRGYSGSEENSFSELLNSPFPRGLDDRRLWSTYDPLVAGQYSVPRSGLARVKASRPGALEMYGLRTEFLEPATGRRYKFRANSRYSDPNSLLDDLDDYEVLDRQLRKDDPAAYLAEYLSGSTGGRHPKLKNFGRLGVFDNVPEQGGRDKQQQLLVRPIGQKGPLRMINELWSRDEVPKDIVFQPKARGGSVR